MEHKYSSRILSSVAGKKFRLAIFAIVLLLPSITKAASWNYALGSASPLANPSGNVCPSANRDTLYKFTITISGSGTANTLNQLTFTTNAGYVASSLVQFELYRSAINSGTPFASVTTIAPGGPGVQTFSPALSMGTTAGTMTFWILMNVVAAPTIGNQVSVAALTTTNFTFSAGTKSGSASAGGTRTIIGITSQPSTSGSVCAGSPVTINIGTSVGPAWTYQWQYNNASVWTNVAPNIPVGAAYSGQTTSSLTVSGLAAGNYQYKCIVGGACGITSNTVTVVVQAMQTYTPQIDAYVNATVPFYLQPGDPNNVTMCFRTSVDFSLYSVFPPVPMYTLQWMVNNTVVGSIPPTTYSTNLLNNGDSVSLVFTNLGTQCYNSPTTSNKWYFTVYPSDPPDAMTATISNPPYCIGQNISFNATVGGQLGTSPIYKWLDNNVPIPGATALNYTGTFTAGTHPISFVVQSSDTCSSPSTDTLFVSNLNVGLCYDTMPCTGWTTINRCGGLFYDDGGPSSNYTNANSTGLLTILPTTAGQYVTVTFTSFASQVNIDRLRIFSGTDTSLFLGQLTGVGSACGTFTSASANGGLTFKWITDGSVNGTGWVANLGCSLAPSIVTPGTNCSNPVNIATLPYSVAGQTNQCFSNSHVSGMGCATSNVGGNDNFYKYVATGAECITVFVNNASNNSISLNVYQGCPGAGGTCIGFWTGATAGTLGGQITLPSSGTYYFVVDANTGVNFTYNLNITSFGSAPLNDLPCNAEALIQTVPHFDDNSCAGTESGGGVDNTNCTISFGNINSLWYTFTTNPGQTSVRIRFTRALGTLPDLVVQLYGGTCSALNYISCNNLSVNGFWDCMSQPQLTVSVSPSTTYYIRVDGQGNATGSYQILVDDPGSVTPAYGYDCGNPILINSLTCTYGTPAFIGVGDQCDFPTFNNAGFAGERDGVWFMFETIAGQNGISQLTFDIASDPSVTTDWDFLLINVTSQYPSNICSYISSGSWNTAPGMLSSSWVDTWQSPCNGHTGCRVSGSGNLQSFPFNAAVPLSGTQWWMLYISNFRYSQFPYGFTLDLRYSNTSANIGSQYNPGSTSAVVLNSSVPPQMIWWTGQANTTDWFNITNWGGCAVPSCTDNTSATIASVYSPGLPFPTINATGALTKNLTIRPSGSLTMTPSAQLDVCGNWLNIGTFTAQSGSTVRATQDQFQYFDGSMAGSNAFSNFIMTKSLAPLRPLTLFNKMEVNGALTLTAGKIVTNAKELYLSNTSPSLYTAPNGNNNSYVQGNLRRAISASGGSYDFPVGIASSYQRANVNFTTATTIPTLLANFTGTAIAAQPGPLGPECPNYDYTTLAPLNNGYWTITASANPTSGNYNMKLYNTNYSNSGSAFAWTVLKAPTPAGPWSLNGNCAAVSTANTTERDAMNGFSSFTAGQAGNPGPVPVELLTLSATLENTGVAVNWETASEINNDHFEIERSQDGEHFENIGLKKGAGNSTVNLYYTQFDPNPFSGINYYRLKQVDFDGTFKYSDKVYVVVNPAAGMVSVYPNPAQTDLWCNFYSDGAGKLQFEIMDVLGKTYATEVRDAKKGLNEEVKFNISNLPQGVYFIRVKALDDSNIMPSSQMRFVKQMKQE